jgi:hypothetical protein
MMQVIDVEQGTPEWYAARLGIPTASAFSTILSSNKEAKDKKTRTEYMRKLAGEIVTGEPMESYSNVHMERGKVQEDEARDLYAFMRDCDPQRVGFIRNGERGCSPDSLIGDDGGLEIKTALPHIQIDRLLRGTLPAEHKAQVQGNIWLCERKFWDFVSYCPKLPLLVVRVKRDDEYIAQLEASVDQFNTELKQLVEQIMAFHAKEAA